MSEKKTFAFPGKDLDVTWDGRICIHVGECTRAKGELFKSGRKPWGEPDRAPADEVAEVVRRCPTGALTYTRKDGGEGEAAPAENSITVANNGPLYVSGRLDIEGAPEDMPGVRYRAALCRCGDSKNKPFCDNTHEKAGFVDRGAIGDRGTPLEDEGGTLRIERAPDGPLLLSGNMTLYNAASRPAWQGQKAALCRCGKSENKPFCDGAHKAAGFKAE